MVTKYPLLTAAPHALVSRSETDAPDGEYELKGTRADTADSHDMSTVPDVPAKFLAAGYGWEAKQLKIKCYIDNANARLEMGTDFDAAKVVCSGKQAATLRPVERVKFQPKVHWRPTLPSNGVDVRSIRSCNKRASKTCEWLRRQLRPHLRAKWPSLAILEWW